MIGAAVNIKKDAYIVHGASNNEAEMICLILSMLLWLTLLYGWSIPVVTGIDAT